MTPTQALEALERVRERLVGAHRTIGSMLHDQGNALPEWFDQFQNALTELPAAISALKAMVGEVDEAESALVDYFEQKVSREFPNAAVVPSREHHQLRAKPIVQVLRPYLRPLVEQQTVEELVRKLEGLPDFQFSGTDLIHKYQAIEIIRQHFASPISGDEMGGGE